MNNINPTKNLNRRSLFYVWIMGLPMLLMGLIGLVSIILMYFLPLFGDTTIIVMVVVGLLSLLAVIGGGVSIYRGATLTRDNEVALQVGEFLKPYLDDRFTFIRNVSRRGLGYIDAVMIGPPGALVFRTMTDSGVWRNELAEWKTKDANGKVKNAPKNPSRECARDVYALRKFLAKRQLGKIPVYGVVVFHNRNVTLQGVNPVVPISETHLLYDILQRDYLAEEQRITPEQSRRAIAAITEG